MWDYNQSVLPPVCPEPVDAYGVSPPLSQTHYTVPDTEKDLESLSATVECEQPQPDLYK